MQLTKQHFLQEKRIPYGTVLYGDELDKLFADMGALEKAVRKLRKKGKGLSRYVSLRDLQGISGTFAGSIRRSSRKRYGREYVTA